MAKRLKKPAAVEFVQEMVHIYFAKHVSRSSAELAYFMGLTFFPILICVNALVGALQLDAGGVLRALEPFLPPSMLSIVSEYLRYITVNDSPALFAAGLFMTLLSASSAMRGLMDIMDEIYERKAYRGVKQIVASVLGSLLLLVAIYLSIAVVFTGNWFFNLTRQYLPIQLPVLFDWNWQWMRFLVLFGVVYLLVALVYLIAAPLGKPRAPVFTGALLASLALVAASVVFSWFIGLSSRYSLVYGSLASVIILLLWLFICGNVVILGNVFNCVWYRRRQQREQKQKSENNT